jgi:outer membrane protein OmpA-like peptidoglycan-associated protein
MVKNLSMLCPVWALYFLLMAPGVVVAQTAVDMDALLGSEAVDYVQAAHFVLKTADAIDENSSAETAYALAREKGWAPQRGAGYSPIQLGELCFLIVNAFNIEGSFLYALFPGPHYAFRELDYLKLIPGRRDPATTVSGERLLQILGMVTAYKGETVPTAPAMKAEATGLAKREEIAVAIRTELEQQGVADTSVRVVEEGVVISLNNIQFAPDSADLLEQEQAKLREIAAILERYPEQRILVGGHTALAGTAEGRLQISTARAQAVADYLIFLGVRQREDIIVQGYGAEQPLGDNATVEGLALNRRVEIILLDKDAQ